MNYNTYMPVKIISGEDCVKKFEFVSYGRKCLIITGKTGAVKSGLLEHLTKTLSNQCITYDIYDAAMPNPKVSACYEAGEAARICNADFIIGAGGGSAMDLAKAAAVFAYDESLSPADIYTPGAVTGALPIILIGTTAGTGSEVTHNSVLVDDTESPARKHTFRSPYIFASVCLCDAQYTITLPWDITVNTALDTICHCVESLYTAGAGSFERMYALKGLSICWENLIKAHWKVVVEKKSMEYGHRKELLYASILAGMAINATGTCFAHTLGYCLTTEHDVPHGKACAAFLPDFVRMMAAEDKETTEQILKAVNETDIEIFLNGITSMVGSLPKLTDGMAREYAEYAAQSAALKKSVVPLSEEGAYKLYKKLFVK